MLISAAHRVSISEFECTFVQVGKIEVMLTCSSFRREAVRRVSSGAYQRFPLGKFVFGVNCYHCPPWILKAQNFTLFIPTGSSIKHINQ